MRTAKIEIDGKHYLLCFSGRVLRNVTEHFGGVREMYQALGQKDKTASFDATIWTLAQMIQAGDRYAALAGLDNPGALDAETLYDLADIRELSGLYGKIAETITNGQAATVSAKAAPSGAKRGNADATPGSS